MRTEDGYKELYAELRGYEEKGVDIVMDGYPMSPLQIVTAYMAREEGTYMRDYVIDPEGRIESVSLYSVLFISVLVPCRFDTSRDVLSTLPEVSF